MRLPPPLAASLRRYAWRQLTIGESTAEVFRLTAPGEADLILKTLVRDPVFSLAGEAARLRWLAPRAPVPEVVDFVTDATRDFLLMRALPGEDAATAKVSVAELVDLLADGLRQLHAVPVQDCPFSHSIDEGIAAAGVRVAEGCVDLDNLDPANLGRDPADLFQDLLAARPAGEERVLTHGDFCLPNVMVAAGRLSGFIDVGLAGVGDPYRDLALAGRSLDRNAGPGWTEKFLARYGLAEPDPARMRYFVLLDEFF